MICPECKDANQKSTVTPGMTMTTLLGYSPGYYDEDGKYVRNPDPNWHTTMYSCSNGHVFDIVRREGEPDRIRPGISGAGPCYSPPNEIVASPGAQQEGTP